MVDFNFSLDDDWIDEIEFDDDSPEKEKEVWCGYCQKDIKQSEMKLFFETHRARLLCPICEQTLMFQPSEED